MSKINTQHVDALSKLLLHTRGMASMKNLVRGLFTESEIEEFARRIEIVKMIKKDVPQHKIALTLGVGVATVTRGVREIKLGRFKNI
jgi:TrpR family trp operon transcriptional repressor